MRLILLQGIESDKDTVCNKENSHVEQDETTKVIEKYIPVNCPCYLWSFFKVKKEQLTPNSRKASIDN